MLNVKILNEKEGKLQVRVSIKKRHLDSEPILIYREKEIKEAVKKEVSKKYDNCEIIFSSYVRKLKNHNNNSLVEQDIYVEIVKKSKKLSTAKTSAKKVTKKKSNHKVKPGESSGSSKS
tara:strand:- start:120 stop:476 length:357 start_codon:yes stop_codon:yes gene_type:complete